MSLNINMLKEKLKREFLYDLYENYVPHQYFNDKNNCLSIEDILCIVNIEVINYNMYMNYIQRYKLDNEYRFKKEVYKENTYVIVTNIEKSIEVNKKTLMTFYEYTTYRYNLLGLCKHENNLIRINSIEILNCNNINTCTLEHNAELMISRKVDNNTIKFNYPFISYICFRFWGDLRKEPK